MKRVFSEDIETLIDQELLETARFIEAKLARLEECRWLIGASITFYQNGLDEVCKQLERLKLVRELNPTQHKPDCKNN